LLPAKTWERDYNKWEPIEIKQGETVKGDCAGTTNRCGQDHWVSAARARDIRLYVLKVKRPININEFQIFAPEKKL